MTYEPNQRPIIVLSPHPSDGGRSIADRLRSQFQGQRAVFKRTLSSVSRLPRDTLDNALIINWGCTPATYPQFLHRPVSNLPSSVRTVVRKDLFFDRVWDYNQDSNTHPDRKLVTVPYVKDPMLLTPDFFRTQRRHSRRAFIRTRLTSHGGEGIVVAPDWGTFLTLREDHEEVRNARLIVQEFKKSSEYRIHFMGRQIFDSARKVRDPLREPSNWLIRSHNNGFIYTRNGDSEPPYQVLFEVQKMLDEDVFGLDFGAVDVLYSSFYNRAMILEINTAPGLTGQTLDNYANRFFSHIQG